MTRIRASWKVTLALLALTGFATCGGDSGGSSPTTPAAPAPAPLTPLSWLDVPTEVVAVRVGETRVVNVRLSAAIDASVTFFYVESQVAVEGVDLRPGVVQLTITGVGPGEDTIDLVAEAPGYQTAEASFSVRVEEAVQIATGRMDFTDPVFGGLAFKSLDDAEAVLRIAIRGDLAGMLDYLASLEPSARGQFVDGDPIEWDGEERLLLGVSAAIRVSGRPGDGEGGLFPRSQWWVLKQETSFRDVPPKPPAALAPPATSGVPQTTLRSVSHLRQ